MNGGLHFDIDLQQLTAAGGELQASEKQVRAALSRAIARTATTLRTMSARGLATELELRTISLLRRRLKSLRMRVGKDGGVSLWYGLNDMPVSWFKGTPRRTSAGASHRGQEIKGGFVARSQFKGGKKTIFKRTGKDRLPVAEQNLPVEDRAVVFIEDRIFDQTEEIFWKHFMRDLKARVSFEIGER